MTHKQRSDHIVNWINAHPLINYNQLCKMAGGADGGNFYRALRKMDNRLVSKQHIDAIERILQDYGFEPLTLSLPHQVNAMNFFLDEFQLAMDNEDRQEIIRLYDLSFTNSLYHWDIAPTEVQDRYTELTARAVDMLDRK